MSNKLSIPIFVGAIGLTSMAFAQQPARPRETIRVIAFDAKTPIANRLQPGDDVVVIEKDRFPPGIAVDDQQNLDAALDHALMHDTVVMASGLVMGGTLIDDGTWIQ